MEDISRFVRKSAQNSLDDYFRFFFFLPAEPFFADGLEAVLKPFCDRLLDSLATFFTAGAALTAGGGAVMTPGSGSE